MTQKQFLRSLSHKLRGVPALEREEALRYYREYLQDAALEPKADVTPLVGTPGECARGILADSLIRQERAAQKAAEPARSDGGRVVLGVLMLPVWLIAFAVLLSLGVSGAALALGGAAALPAAFLMVGELGQALVVAGYGLLLISVGVLLIIGTAALWRLCVRGAAALLRRKGAEDA